MKLFCGHSCIQYNFHLYLNKIREIGCGCSLTNDTDYVGHMNGIVEYDCIDDEKDLRGNF